MTTMGEETESASQRRIAELRTLLDQGIREGVGVGSSLGISVESLTEGRAVYVLDPSPATINAMFTVHGGVLATLMDTAMGSAVFTRLGDGAYYTTIELTANFIRSARADGKTLTCVAQTIHVGRHTATAEARITGPDGRLVAHATSTCMIFSPV
jgi:acyl-CoA thioesterase